MKTSKTLGTLKGRLVACLLFMIACTAVRSQTFYELNFQIPGDDDEYVGLIIYTDEAHCKMRLISNETLISNEYYEANYECVIEEKQDSSDVGVMLYVPDDDDMPILMWSWEKDDQSDQPEAPYVVFDIDDEDMWIKSTAFKEITLADMDEDYVMQFYNDDEPEYEMMLKGIQTIKDQAKPKVVMMPEPTIEGMEDMPMPTMVEREVEMVNSLHLVVTANTNVSDIGMACMVDLNRVRSEFAGISKVLDLKLDETIVANNDYSREQLIEALNNLKPEPNDVVVFVYSGHGFRFKDQKDYYPNMDLSPTAYDEAKDNYLPLSQVFDSITAKGARLNIVLSDCCNSEIDETLPIISTNSLFSRSNKNFDRQKMRSLFLQSEGNIIATAASPGEVSWCGSNGGFFLLSLIESLRNQISALSDDDPSWENLVQNAIDAAALKSESNKNCKKQNGVKYVKVKSIG